MKILCIHIKKWFDIEFKFSFQSRINREFIDSQKLNFNFEYTKQNKQILRMKFKKVSLILFFSCFIGLVYSDPIPVKDCGIRAIIKSY